jgi:hypothetical protein
MAFTVQESVLLVERYLKTDSFGNTNTDLCRLCVRRKVPKKSVIWKRVKMFTETVYCVL